jgi:hypothetical protein
MVQNQLKIMVRNRQIRSVFVVALCVVVVVGTSGIGTAVDQGTASIENQATTANSDSADLSVDSQTTTELAIAGAEGAENETVQIPVNATAANVSSFDVNITFDPSVVQVQSVDSGDFGDPSASINNESGWITLDGLDFGGIDDPTLGVITFELVGEPDEYTAVSFDKNNSQITDTNNNIIEIDTYDNGGILVNSEDPVFDGSVAVESASGNPGKQVTVNVSATAQDVAGFDTRVSFDPAVIELDSVGAGDFGSPNATIDNTDGTVELRSAGNAVDDPLLATLTFTLAGNDGDQSSLVLNQSRTNLTHETDEIEVSSYGDGTIQLGATDQPTVTVSDVETAPNGTVTTDISTTAEDVSTVELNMTFDPGVVEVSDVTKGDLSQTTPSFDNENGWLSISGLDLAGVDSPTLAVVEFKSVGSAGTSTSVAFKELESTITDSSNDDIPVSYDSGSVSISESFDAFELDGAEVINQYGELNATSIPEGEAVQNENVTLRATLVNTANSAESVDVEFTFAGTQITEGIFVSELDGGANTQVYAEVQLGTDIDPGNYTYGFSAAGGDAEANATLTVRPIGDVDHSGDVTPTDALDVFLDASSSDSPGTPYNRAGGDILTRDGVTTAQEALEVYLIGANENRDVPSLKTYVIDSGTR